MRKSLQRLYWRYIAWKYDTHRQLEPVFAQNQSGQFLQIGANDASGNDPIPNLLKAHPGWTGVFVEPVPHVFKRLQTNYGSSPRYKFLNVAVGRETKIAPFHCISDAARKEHPELPGWVEEIGSFNPEYPLDNRYRPILENYLQAIDVRCLNFTDLLKEADLTAVDILFMDTEGWDWEILQQIDLATFRPTVTVFEYCVLSPEDQKQAKNFLSPHYNLRSSGNDYFCWRKS